MPFVQMDADGRIVAVYDEPTDGAVEVAAADPALAAFTEQNLGAVGLQDDWVQSDLGLARVIEDLIEILIDKKLILFTDFPEGAQNKLRDRRGLRKEFDLVENLFGGDEAFDPESGDGGLL